MWARALTLLTKAAHKLELLASAGIRTTSQLDAFRNRGTDVADLRSGVDSQRSIQSSQATATQLVLREFNGGLRVNSVSDLVGHFNPLLRQAGFGDRTANILENFGANVPQAASWQRNPANTQRIRDALLGAINTESQGQTTRIREQLGRQTPSFTAPRDASPAEVAFLNVERARRNLAASGVDAASLSRQSPEERTDFDRAVNAFNSSGNRLEELAHNTQEATAEFARLNAQINQLNGQLGGRSQAENLPGFVGPPSPIAEPHARGGPIFRAQGTDTVACMLTPGETITNVRSSQANRGLLARINAANGPLYLADGGEVPKDRLRINEAMERGIDEANRDELRRLNGVVDTTDIPPGLPDVRLSANQARERGAADFHRQQQDAASLESANRVGEILAQREASKRFDAGVNFLAEVNPNGATAALLFQQRARAQAGVPLDGVIPVGPKDSRVLSRNDFEHTLRTRNYQANVARQAAVEQQIGYIAGASQFGASVANFNARSALANAHGGPGSDGQRDLAGRSLNILQSNNQKNVRQIIGAGIANLSRATSSTQLLLLPEKEPEFEFNFGPRNIARSSRGFQPHRGLEFVQPRHFANGGLVNDGPAGVDAIDAKLSKNEFVLRPSAVRQIGVDNLNRINNNPVKFANGGLVGGGSSTGEGGSTQIIGNEQLVAALGAFGQTAATLDTTFANFATSSKAFADSLAAFPRTITMHASHDVNIFHNGIEILNQLNPQIQELVANKVRDGLQIIANQLPQANLIIE